MRHNRHMAVKGKRNTVAKQRTGTISKDRLGRVKPFEPTEEQRKLVLNMSGIGCTNDELLLCIPWGRPDDKPIDEKTLLKYFKPELARGRAVQGMKLKRTAFDLAVGGDKTMLIFLLKTKHGYSETVKVENTGKDGAPLPAATVVAGPLLYLPAKDADPHASTPAPSGASTGEQA